MTREALEKLIDDDLLAAFAAMDQLDWRSYQGTYLDLKAEWVDMSQGTSKTSFRSRLKTLLSLHFSEQLLPVFSSTRLLTPPPFIPELFLGREADLEAVYHKLFHEEHLLLLVNGQGGIGKTTLAAKYWERYKSQYSHVAWVFAGDDLMQALLALAPELNLSFPETMPNAERLPLLIKALCALDKPCLLIIDNANNLSELENNYLALRSCANFHILLTSRITEFEQAARHAIQTLEQDVAIELFQRHYPRYQPSEQVLLLQILNAVGYNTLVIELLAKNLRNLNKLREQYSLQQLLQDFQDKGILGISQSSSVNTVYQAKGAALRQANPEVIIRAMYELGDLVQEEKELLSVFAVLPAERIELATLEKLLPNTPLDTSLSNLTLLGWLDFEELELSFKISPVVQQIVQEQNQANLKADCQLLINSLKAQLRWEGSGHYADYKLAGKLAAYASSVIGCFKTLDNDIALLCDKVGKYHQITGNLSAALFYFEQYQQIAARLYASNPENVTFKNGLAISYGQLGQTHSDLGNLEQALTYFEQYHELEKELYASYTQNVSYKYNLAISYEKLGSTHRDLGNLEQALIYFEQCNELKKQLFASHPQNVSYKDGLAISFSKLGDTHRALGNLERALTYFEERGRIGQELYSSYPQNVYYKNGLAISYERLGSTHRDLGNLEQALTYYVQYHELEKALNASYPENVSYKNNFAISYAKLGDTHRDLGNLEQALTYFKDFNKLEKALNASYTQNVSFKNGLAISYSKLGMIHLLREDFNTAQEAFASFNQLCQELYAQAPNNLNFYSNYAEALAAFAALKQLQGENGLAELAAAQAHFEQMQQHTGSEYYAQKSALVAQMQSPGADLRALIIELSKS